MKFVEEHHKQASQNVTRKIAGISNLLLDRKTSPPLITYRVLKLN